MLFQKSGFRSVDLIRLKSFRCRTLYRKISVKPGSFESRLQEEMFLLHDGGGVYFVLGRNGIVLTKHVQMFENEFPRLGSLRPLANLHEDFDGEFSERDYRATTRHGRRFGSKKQSSPNPRILACSST